MSALDLMVELLRSAGDVLLARRAGTAGRTIERKTTQADLVCDADRASEESLLELLARRAPDDAVISEEAGVVGGRSTSTQTWVLDPLDGTTNFLAGLDDFGVIVGLLDGGQPVAGGMYLPVHDLLYLAQRGTGATRNGDRVRVATTTDVADAFIDHSLVCLPGILAEQRRTLDLLLPAVRAVRCNQSLRYIAHVLDGTYDAFVYHSLSLWDLAGPSVILAEAGATVSDLAGQPIDVAAWCDSPKRLHAVVAANPALHARLVELLGRVPT